MMAPIEDDEALMGVSAIAGRSAWKPVCDRTVFVLRPTSFIASVVGWDTLRPGASPSVVALDGVNLSHTTLLARGVILSALLFCLDSSRYQVSGILFVPIARGDAPCAVTLAARLRRRAARARAGQGPREVRLCSVPLRQLCDRRRDDMDVDRRGSREGRGVPVLDPRRCDRGGVSGILGLCIAKR